MCKQPYTYTVPYRILQFTSVTVIEANWHLHRAPNHHHHCVNAATNPEFLSVAAITDARLNYEQGISFVHHCNRCHTHTSADYSCIGIGLWYVYMFSCWWLSVSKLTTQIYEYCHNKMRLFQLFHQPYFMISRGKSHQLCRFIIPQRHKWDS